MSPARGVSSGASKWNAQLEHLARRFSSGSGAFFRRLGISELRLRQATHWRLET